MCVYVYLIYVANIEILVISSNDDCILLTSLYSAGVEIFNININMRRSTSARVNVGGGYNISTWQWRKYQWKAMKMKSVIW